MGFYNSYSVNKRQYILDKLKVKSLYDFLLQLDLPTLVSTISNITKLAEQYDKQHTQPFKRPRT